MEKEWSKGSIDIYFDDLANEKVIKRSYPNTVQGVTPEQVEGFTVAIESLAALPTAHTVVVEEYKYRR